MVALEGKSPQFVQLILRRTWISEPNINLFNSCWDISAWTEVKDILRAVQLASMAKPASLSWPSGAPGWSRTSAALDSESVGSLPPKLWTLRSQTLSSAANPLPSPSPLPHPSITEMNSADNINPLWTGKWWMDGRSMSVTHPFDVRWTAGLTLWWRVKVHTCGRQQMLVLAEIWWMVLKEADVCLEGNPAAQRKQHLFISYTTFHLITGPTDVCVCR